jgi:elongation factor G
VVYQETIAAKGVGKGQFNRELGETMHFGCVELSVEPLPRDKERTVSFEVDTTAWPEAWLEAVSDGILDGLQSGVIRGYPVQNVRVRVLNMERRDGDSSPVGYRMASAMALKEALSKAEPKLMEPIMWVEINVPEEFVGDVVCLLGAKGAKIENMIDR